LKKKAEWRKGVGEHSVPRERHGIYCEDQRVWNWRYKGFQFVICPSSREKWYIQGQSLVIFTLGYSQGETMSERLF
jgi:hypothetical protein